MPIDADGKSKNSTLLPTGLRDQLPPRASQEARAVGKIIGCCEAFGYQRVKPPLIEFEDSLFCGPGASMMQSTFRLMDPVSQRMLGIRSDLTVQVARIAANRLGHLARPLRLCYSGEVLRVMPDDLNPERELVQVGAELIGEDNPLADVEIILLAYDSLSRIGVKNMSVDITAPALVPTLMKEFDLTSTRYKELRGAMDRKDLSAVEKIAGSSSPVLIDLIFAAGQWKTSLQKIKSLDLPKVVEPIIDRLERVAPAIGDGESELVVTIDPVESRGFEYYTGLGFSFFSEGIRGELGRGGRYSLIDSSSENSCGFTLYMETVVKALPEPDLEKRLLLPIKTKRRQAEDLRASGWSTVNLLREIVDLRAEAKRLGCSHVLIDGHAQEI